MIYNFSFCIVLLNFIATKYFDACYSGSQLCDNLYALDIDNYTGGWRAIGSAGVISLKRTQYLEEYIVYTMEIKQVIGR
jgi:hypothetical protein